MEAPEGNPASDHTWSRDASVVTHSNPSHPDYYKEGCAKRVAQSQLFEQGTLLVISVNAVWIAVAVDGNKEPSLLTAEPQFVVMENLFCVYYSFELLVRFLAVSNKWHLLRDAWFVFDSLLLILMVFETWILTGFIYLTGRTGDSPLGGLAILKLLRLLRLTRLMRLMRALPELMVLLRGMASAARSVMVTLLLLLIIVYVFSVLLVQMLEDVTLEEDKFTSVPRAMYTLIVDGILPDHEPLLSRIEQVGWMPTVITLSFVVVATFTVLNMLVGILCEVACRVSQLSREQIEYQVVQNKLADLTGTIDVNGDGEISREEFLEIVENDEAVQAMKALGVDVLSLKEQSEYVYANEDIGEDGEPIERKLNFPGFMEVVNSMRPMNSVTVKDVVALRKFFHTRMCGIEDKLGLTVSRGSITAEVSVSEGAALHSNEVPDAPEIGYSNGNAIPERADGWWAEDAIPADTRWVQEVDLALSASQPVTSGPLSAQPATRAEVHLLRQQVLSLRSVAERLMDSQVQLSGNVQALHLRVGQMFEQLSKEPRLIGGAPPRRHEPASPVLREYAQNGTSTPSDQLSVRTLSRLKTDAVRDD